jgi:hypothetical protein
MVRKLLAILALVTLLLVSRRVSVEETSKVDPTDSHSQKGTSMNRAEWLAAVKRMITKQFGDEKGE